MSPWGQRYFSQGRFAPRSPYEHLARTGRAVLPTLQGYDDGGAVDDGQQVDQPQANPYSSLPPESQARQDEAYNTSISRLKQLGNDVFFAPVGFLKAPPWEQAAGLIGGMKAPRWTPAQDVALSKYIKGDALA